MANVFFITGAEGAGNSSIIKFLRDLFVGFDVHDFDEVGVPNNPPLQWRLDTTEYWLKVAAKNTKINVSTIISGLSFPSEVNKSPSFEDTANIFFCLLDVSESERKRRLEKRGASQNVIADTNQLHMMRDEFRRCSNCFVIDTTSKNLQEVERKVASWIKGIEGLARTQDPPKSIPKD
jgi:dephospho-CoA kinase